MKGIMSSLVSLMDVGGGRVLASLGMGFITFGAFTALVTSFTSTVSGYWGGIGGSALQLISLAGFPEALGMVIGAIVTRISISALPKLGKIA